MRTFAAANYSMGTRVLTARFEAFDEREALRVAERRVPGANALPGQGPGAAARAQVIGVREVSR